MEEMCCVRGRVSVARFAWRCPLSLATFNAVLLPRLPLLAPKVYRCLGVHLLHAVLFATLGALFGRAAMFTVALLGEPRVLTLLLVLQRSLTSCLADQSRAIALSTIEFTSAQSPSTTHHLKTNLLFCG